MWRASPSSRVQGDEIARWVRRHRQGARLLATLQASDLAMQQVIERVRREDPGATPAQIRAYIRRLREGI
jgi:hypothetical protein